MTKIKLFWDQENVIVLRFELTKNKKKDKMSKSKEIRNGEIEKDLAVIREEKKYSNVKFVIIYFFIRVA